MVGPSVGAREERAPTVAAAATICGPEKKAKAAVKTVGISEPPRKPCSARKTIMLWMSHAQPQRSEVSVKPAADAANSQRVDITRESQPESGMTMISAIR